MRTIQVLLLAVLVVACGSEEPIEHWSELQGGKAEMTASRAGQLPQGEVEYLGTGLPKPNKTTFYDLSIGTRNWYAIDFAFAPASTVRKWRIEFAQSILANPQEPPSVQVRYKADNSQYFATRIQIEKLDLDPKTWQAYSGSINLSQTANSVDKPRIFFKYAPLGLMGGDGRLRVKLTVSCQSGC